MRARRPAAQNEKGATSELDPLCVLDFYVNESCQRKGCDRLRASCVSHACRARDTRGPLPFTRRLGRTLFDAVVEREGVDAAHLAYDRPSAKARTARGAAMTGTRAL